jgi:hypothetical protein
MNYGRTSHLRALKPGVAPNAIVGSKFWQSPERARELIAKGHAELVNAGPVPQDSGLLRRRNWPYDRLSSVQRVWEGQTVVCIGGGPSLTLEQIEAIPEGCPVIAINDAYLWAPSADVCYFADSRWWEWHTKGIAKLG